MILKVEFFFKIISFWVHKAYFYVPMPRSSEKTDRYFCYTINNYTAGDVQAVINCNRDPVTGHVAYFEVGEECGTPHIQGYIEFKNAKNYASVVRFFGLPDGVLWKTERCGTAIDAWNYCRKGEMKKALYKKYNTDHEDFMKNAKPVFEDYGECSMQGARNDIHMAAAMITAGHGLKRVAKEHPVAFVKYHKGLQELRSKLFEARLLDAPPTVIVYYGETGTGKSHRVNQIRAELREREGQDVFYQWTPGQGGWFDFYDGESYIWLDEYRGDWPVGELLSLLDRYECKRQRKGGMVQIQAHTIYITSPRHPRDWYPRMNGDDNVDQLRRRITQICRCFKTETSYEMEEVSWDY